MKGKDSGAQMDALTVSVGLRADRQFLPDRTMWRGSTWLVAGEDDADLVIGEQPRAGDRVVNVWMQEHVTNVRSSNREVDERLSPPQLLSLDEAIECLGNDELLEVRPQSLRIRKCIPDSHTRGREEKRAKEAVKA